MEVEDQVAKSDVSSKELLEKHGLQILEHLPVPVIIVGPGRIPLHGNKSARELLGVEICTGDQGDPLMDLPKAYLAGTDYPYPPERSPLTRALQGESSSVGDLEIRKPDGTICLEVSAVPIFAEAGDVAFAGAAFKDIGSLKKVEKELRERHRELGVLFDQVRSGQERLKALSRRLLEIQEAERRSIARELHDEIGQVLTATKISLQTTLRLPEASPISSYLKEDIAIVERAVQQVRNLSLDLRPSLLDDLGLVAALRWYVDRQAQRSGIQMRFLADPSIKRLPQDIETTCFRIVQEALTNVIRHARADRAEVEVALEEKGVTLLIRDNGLGFDVSKALELARSGKSSGLLGMEERSNLAHGQFDGISPKGSASSKT
ncbi:MAG: histidine kinase [Pseudomonadota bacterium]